METDRMPMAGWRIRWTYLNFLLLFYSYYFIIRTDGFLKRHVKVDLNVNIGPGKKNETSYYLWQCLLTGCCDTIRQIIWEQQRKMYIPPFFVRNRQMYCYRRNDFRRCRKVCYDWNYDNYRCVRKRLCVCSNDVITTVAKTTPESSQSLPDDANPKVPEITP